MSNQIDFAVQNQKAVGSTSHLPLTANVVATYRHPFTGFWGGNGCCASDFDEPHDLTLF